MGDERFQRALTFTLGWEGGYANHPSDPGGETKYGISKRSYPELDIKNLTRSEAAAIYRRDYWERCKCDELPEGLSMAVFDYAVNSGPKRAIEKLQSALGIQQDGVFGQQTRRAIDNAAPDFLLERYIRSRADFLIGLGRPVFLRGWMNRVVSLAFNAGKQSRGPK